MQPDLTPSVSSWIVARAKRLKGTFDPDVAATALSPMGWTVTAETALFPVNGTTYDALRLAQEAAGIAHRDAYAMPSYRDGEEGQWAVAPDIAQRMTVRVVPMDKRGKLTVARPEAGTVYVGAEPRPGQWGDGPMVTYLQNPAIGVVAWRVTSPDGDSAVVVDKPRHKSDPIKADAFWKWAYGKGLQAVCAAQVPAIEAVEKARRRAEAVAKGLGTCGVCFGVHAVHTHGAVVQHGYRMGGATWGHGHNGMCKVSGDCYGVGHLSFEKSSHVTALYGEILHGRGKRFAETADRWEAGEVTRPVWVLFTQAWGRRTEEPSFLSPPRGKTYEEFEPGPRQRKEQVGPGHAFWPWVVETTVKSLRAESAQLLAAADWYAKAAAGWPAYPEGVTPLAGS
jgi:hypothetical protein